MSVDARSRVCNIGGEGEVRKPQILYVSIPQSIVDQLVEAGTREHWYFRVRQIHSHSPVASHFLLTKEIYCYHFKEFELEKLIPNNAWQNYLLQGHLYYPN